MISKTAEYALRAVIYLARNAAGEGGAAERGDGLQRAPDIARVLDVPANYLAKTLHILARAGILASERGPRGGFRLARRPGEIPLADVVSAVDPHVFQRTCLLGRPECSDESSCPVHEHWKRVREPLTRFFHETTLEDVLMDEDRLSRATGSFSDATAR